MLRTMTTGKSTARASVSGPSRRDLLEALLLLPLAAASVRCTGDHRSASIQRLVEAMLAHVPLPDPIAVGRSYLAQLGPGADADALVDDVVGALPAASSIDGLAAGFRSLLTRDFETDAIVSVSGWVLAITEARFCALLVLESEGA